MFFSAPLFAAVSALLMSSVAGAELYYIQNVGTGKCMTVFNGNTSIGAPITLAPCTTDPTQLTWQLWWPYSALNGATALMSVYTGYQASWQQITSSKDWAPGFSILQATNEPAYFNRVPGPNNTFYLQISGNPEGALDMFGSSPKGPNVVPLIYNGFYPHLPSEQWVFVPSH